MRTIRTRVFVLALAALLPAAGYAAGVVELMRYLPDRETVTEGDAVKAAAVLLGERQHVMELAPCEARLRSHGVLDAGDSYKPTRTLHKGFASMVFARTMGLKGGWAGRLSGKLGPRLAYNELEFMNLVPPLGAADQMTGGELLALMKHAQDHMRAEAENQKTIRDYQAKKKARRDSH